MSTVPVLIVGAGPTGLALALTLAKQDVSFRIIEKNTSPRVGNKGAGIQPRTQELHQFLGTLDAIAEKSGPLPPAQFFERGAKEPTREYYHIVAPKEPTPSMPYPNGLLLWQSAHEEVFRNELSKFGISVEFGVCLQSFEQSKESVTATLANGESGKTETVTAAYMVSAEGAHSLVRRELGINFEGETTGRQFVILDIEVLEGLPRDKWCFFGHASSKMTALVPSQDRDSKWFSATCSGPEVDCQKASASREAFIETFYEISGRTDVKFGEMLGIGLYVPNTRMTETFSKGRCFLAGDAAHVHPPMGGQGLNSGIQDSVNLGWKFGHVLNGHSPSSLLNSYSDERIPVISAMLSTTGAILGRTGRADDKKDNSAWDPSGTLDMLGINYRGTSLLVNEIHSEVEINPYYSGQVVKAGDRAPDAPGLVPLNRKSETPMRLFDVFGVNYHTVILFVKDTADLSSLIECLAVYPKGKVRTVIVTSPVSSDAGDVTSDLVLRDTYGHAHHAYGAGADQQDVCVVIVRPDGYVGGMVKGAEGVDRYFKRIFL